MGNRVLAGPATSGLKILVSKRPARRVRGVKRDASSRFRRDVRYGSPAPGAYSPSPARLHLRNHYRSCAPQAGKCGSDDHVSAAALAAPQKMPLWPSAGLGTHQRRDARGCPWARARHFASTGGMRSLTFEAVDARSSRRASSILSGAARRPAAKKGASYANQQGPQS